MRFGSNEMCKIFSPPKAAAASLNDVTDWEGPQIWDIPDRALESEGGSIREGGSMSYNSTDGQHFTPESFWFRIVSSAMAVLPVPRSPMINSRCPRPIGIMLSIALMPVCNGSLTGWRSAMPGATCSTARSSSTTPFPHLH